MTVDADGDVRVAVDRFTAAVVALVDPLKGWINGSVKLGPSVYQQLSQAVPASRVQEFSRRSSRMAAPVWVDAVDLKDRIDVTVRGWLAPATVCRREPTPDRLRRLVGAGWRPQDTGLLEQRSDLLEAWREDTLRLLDPEPVRSVSAPCPSCGATHVYRVKAGEKVRVAALQIVGTSSCVCLACESEWFPDQFVALAKLIGLKSAVTHGVE